MSGRTVGIVASSYILLMLGVAYLNVAKSEATTYGNVSGAIGKATEKVQTVVLGDQPVIDPDPPAHVKAQDLKLVETFAAGMGLNRIPKVIYSCKWGDTTGFAAAFEVQTWTLSICNQVIKSEYGYGIRVFSIAHELGHAVDHEQGNDSSEMSADGRAIDYLASIGFWGAIKAKVDYSADGAYKPGELYAKQVLSKAGKL